MLEVVVSVAVPSCVDPSAKLTLPVGAVVPLEGLTVTVRVVEPLEDTAVELAATVVVVGVGGGVTVIVSEFVSFRKSPVAA